MADLGLWLWGATEDWSLFLHQLSHPLTQCLQPCKAPHSDLMHSFTPQSLTPGCLLGTHSVP